MPVARENGECRTWRRFERGGHRDEVAQIRIAEAGKIGGCVPKLLSGANKQAGIRKRCCDWSEVGSSVSLLDQFQRAARVGGDFPRELICIRVCPDNVADGHLAEVAHAISGLGFVGDVSHRQDHGYQYRDDRNYHEQFDQREGCFAIRGDVFHSKAIALRNHQPIGGDGLTLKHGGNLLHLVGFNVTIHKRQHAASWVSSFPSEDCVVGGDE